MTEQFDVFLCHNSEDKPQVIEIAKQLKQYGLKPWLDVWELRPGYSWQRVLEAQIEHINVAAVFVGKNGLGPWQQQEIDAFLREFVNRSCPVIPVLLPDAPKKPKLPLFLNGLMWVDFRTSDPDPIKQLCYGITGNKFSTDPASDDDIVVLNKNESTKYFSSEAFRLIKTVTLIWNNDKKPISRRKFIWFILIGIGSVAAVKMPEILRFIKIKGENFINQNKIFSSHIVNLPNGIKLDMVQVPAGTFLMGSPDNDPYVHEREEKPQHEVTLSGFLIGKYPVTQEQYKAVMGSNPSSKDNPKNPVEQVTWQEAQDFCKKLSQLTRLNFRLSTEAEWEYACRAETTTFFYFGDDDTEATKYAWYGLQEKPPQPVGQRKPNNWGLFDMAGNVWEWCGDPFHYTYKDKPDDIKNNGNKQWSSANTDYVIRGGSIHDKVADCRSAARMGIKGTARTDTVGFRVVLFPV